MRGNLVCSIGRILARDGSSSSQATGLLYAAGRTDQAATYDLENCCGRDELFQRRSTYRAWPQLHAEKAVE